MDGRYQSGILLDLSTEGALEPGVSGSSWPADLRVLDGALQHERPDIGCFRSDATPLSVGVDGYRKFPAS
jgi:hypothetical protein